MNENQRKQLVKQARELIALVDRIDKADMEMSKRVEAIKKIADTSFPPVVNAINQIWEPDLDQVQLWGNDTTVDFTDLTKVITGLEINSSPSVYTESAVSVYAPIAGESSNNKRGKCWGLYIPLLSHPTGDHFQLGCTTATRLAGLLESRYPQVGTSRASLVYAMLEACGLAKSWLENGQIKREISPAVSSKYLKHSPRHKGLGLQINQHWFLYHFDLWILHHSFSIKRLVGSGIEIAITNKATGRTVVMVYDRRFFSSENFLTNGPSGERSRLAKKGTTAIWYPANIC
jgi:hypothetical protein